MKKIIVINASQSKRACARRLVDSMVEYIKTKGNVAVTSFGDVTDAQWNYEDVGEVDYSILYFDLKKLTFKGCIDCSYCKKHRGCMLRDDIKYMYRYFDEMDYLILASPVYFDSTPSKLKALVDRTQAIYHSKFTLMNSMIDRRKKRFAMNILVGGEKPRENQFLGSRLVLDYFYRSVNTKVDSYTEFSDTDVYDPNEDSSAIEELRKKVDELLANEPE